MSQIEAPPTELVDAIQAGECVAFVGAGFSAAAGLPSWGELLSRLANTRGVPASVRMHVMNRIQSGTGHAFDEAAQLLQDVLAPESFHSQLRKELAPDLRPEVQQRLQWLRGIPFRAVLTTNFDSLLPGLLPERESYRSVLRSSPFRWWDKRFWHPEGRDSALKGATTIKLHGDLSKPTSIVLSRLDYRRRLYEDPAYMSFLRAVLAQRTILYLGFSFADAYLNELRSEALALLGGGSPPVAYAVLNDVPDETCNHFRKNEGIHVLKYEAPNHNHADFDRILKSIHDSTNPAVRFGRLLDGIRILWLDHKSAFEYNRPVFEFLERAAKLGDVRPAVIDRVLDHEAAIDRIQKQQTAGSPYDLVITHWGHDLARSPSGVPMPVGERVLREMRKRELEAPVLVFSSGAHMDENKRSASRLGAQGYFCTHGGILRGIERVFALGVESV